MVTQPNWHAQSDWDTQRETARRHLPGPPAVDPYALRPLPNEEVWLFRKAIDNSRLVREPDPNAGRRCGQWIAVTAAVTLLAAASLWPRVEETLAGYRIEALRQERESLLAERAALDLAEARLLDPRRLEELARIQQFVDPAPSQVVHLNPKGRNELAYRPGTGAAPRRR